jgi:hypothetical protein
VLPAMRNRECCFRAVATVTEIRDPVVDDDSLTISSPCPSVLSAGGRERTPAHRAPIRLVPEASSRAVLAYQRAPPCPVGVRHAFSCSATRDQENPFFMRSP